MTVDLAQARSSAELEKALQDPVLAACIGGRQVDETALSRFRNDNRFDWGGVLEGVGERLQAFDLTRADEDGILIVDDTIAEKAGEKTEGVRSDSRALHEPPWYGTVRPVVWEVGGSNPAAYPIRDTLS